MSYPPNLSSHLSSHFDCHTLRYDVSGVPADRIARVIEHDWMHLVRVKGVLDSPSYLKEKGKPVVALWGTCAAPFFAAALF